MKKLMVLVLAVVLLSPAMAFAGSATDAALGLGAFAVFNQMLGGVGIFGGYPAHARVYATPAPVYAAPVYSDPVVYAAPVYVAPRPVVVVRPVVVRERVIVRRAPVYYAAPAYYAPVAVHRYSWCRC